MRSNSAQGMTKDERNRFRAPPYSSIDTKFARGSGNAAH